ncbi:MAG: hypothetical protein L6V78_04090 [Clostridium sp.]|nr:MAG: hypothetical protein L6V78_04090 [Clostridium sp.]
MAEIIINHSVQREATNEILTPYVLTIKKSCKKYIIISYLHEHPEVIKKK